MIKKKLHETTYTVLAFYGTYMGLVSRSKREPAVSTQVTVCGVQHLLLPTWALEELAELAWAVLGIVRVSQEPKREAHRPAPLLCEVPDEVCDLPATASLGLEGPDVPSPPGCHFSSSSRTGRKPSNPVVYSVQMFPIFLTPRYL